MATASAIKLEPPSQRRNECATEAGGGFEGRGADRINHANRNQQERQINERRSHQLRGGGTHQAVTPLTTTRMPSVETIATGVSGAMNSPSVTTSTTRLSNSAFPLGRRIV